MQNKFIENVNYPTYIDGGEGSGKYWNVYFVSDDTKNYVSVPGETGCLISESSLKVNKANQTLYYAEITVDTNVKKVDDKNEYTAKSSQDFNATEIIIKVYTTALEYVTSDSVNAIAVSFNTSGGVVSVERTGIDVVNYNIVSEKLKYLGGNYSGTPLKLTEVTIKLKVNKVSLGSNDFLTGIAELFAYETENNNYNSVSSTKITQITFKRETTKGINDTLSEYYSKGGIIFNANLNSGYKTYQLTVSTAQKDYVTINTIDNNGDIKIDFLKAGTISLNLYCDDYTIGSGDAAVAYFGIDETITLNIKKTPVFVKFKDVSIIYGQTLDIDYSNFEFYENSSVTGVETIKSKELDELEEIFAGITSDYDKSFEYQALQTYSISLSSTTNDYINYTLTYLSGDLTVEKKEITVGFNEKTLYKTYGDSTAYLKDAGGNLVTLALTFIDNNGKIGNAVWEYNDYSTELNKLNPAKGIVLPLILYGSLDIASEVSSSPYQITIDLTGSGNNNYTFKKDSNNEVAKVTVQKRNVVISASNYDGPEIKAGQQNPPEFVVKAFGYDNTDVTSSGAFTYLYSTSKIVEEDEYTWLSWTDFTNFASGNFAIQITFTPTLYSNVDKNYITTTVINNNIAQMELSKPVIEFYDTVKEGVVKFEFTGSSFSQSSIENYIHISAPVGINQTPNGTYEISFKSASNEDSSDLGINTILQAGKYYVYITFNPVLGSVYGITKVEITDMFEVLPASPAISLEYNTVTYTGLNAKVNTPVIVTFPGYELNNDSGYTIVLEYSKAGLNEFSTNVPIDTGTYDIYVRFSGDYRNYKESEDTFPGYLTISPYSFIDEIIINPNNVYEYTGDAVSPPEATYSGLSKGSEIKGTFSYRYRESSNIDGSGNEIIPYNVNSYDMLVIYTPGENDNYAYATRWITNIIQITPVEVNIVVAKREVTYTGALITYNTPTAVGVKGEVVGAKAATKVEFALET
ncbi:MAG: hypothetical protein LBF12_02440, partial [Christensenellaceae bacterium]|nr:hypothetical protein [Christensenellaceae bacterium]